MPHLEFPVFEPATTTNFLALWPAIAETSIMANFLPARPMLYDFTPVAETPIQTPMMQFGGVTSLIRGFFVEGNELAKGLFSVTWCRRWKTSRRRSFSAPPLASVK